MVEARRELRLIGEHQSEAPALHVLWQNALENKQLVGALGAPLLGKKNLCHAAHAEAAHDFKIADLFGRLEGQTPPAV